MICMYVDAVTRDRRWRTTTVNISARTWSDRVVTVAVRTA